jgi:hypothetical protein
MQSIFKRDRHHQEQKLSEIIESTHSATVRGGISKRELQAAFANGMTLNAYKRHHNPVAAAIDAPYIPNTRIRALRPPPRLPATYETKAKEIAAIKEHMRREEFAKEEMILIRQLQATQKSATGSSLPYHVQQHSNTKYDPVLSHMVPLKFEKSVAQQFADVLHNSSVQEIPSEAHKTAINPSRQNQQQPTKNSDGNSSKSYRHDGSNWFHEPKDSASATNATDLWNSTSRPSHFDGIDNAHGLEYGHITEDIFNLLHENMPEYSHHDHGYNIYPSQHSYREENDYVHPLASDPFGKFSSRPTTPGQKRRSRPSSGSYTYSQSRNDSTFSQDSALQSSFGTLSLSERSISILGGVSLPDLPNLGPVEPLPPSKHFISHSTLRLLKKLARDTTHGEHVPFEDGLTTSQQVEDMLKLTLTGVGDVDISNLYVPMRGAGQQQVTSASSRIRPRRRKMFRLRASGGIVPDTGFVGHVEGDFQLVIPFHDEDKEDGIASETDDSASVENMTENSRSLAETRGFLSAGGVLDGAQVILPPVVKNHGQSECGTTKNIILRISSTN